jgi:hypothetical protein
LTEQVARPFFVILSEVEGPLAAATFRKFGHRWIPSMHDAL